MRLILPIVATAFLLSGCAGPLEKPGIALATTFVNYESGVDINVLNSHTDLGRPFDNPGSLIESSNPFTGASLGSIDPEKGLPEWVEFTWEESDPAIRKILEGNGPYPVLPVKSARVSVRSVVPASVLEELRRSPLDPTRANLRLNSMELYFVWTRTGVKVHWQVLQGCCTVMREGGDPIR